MKAQFIKLDTVVVKLDTDVEATGAAEFEDNSIIINVANISSIRRLNYNDTVQTMILMVGGERFGVHQLPEEVIEMVENATENSHAY